MWTANTPVHVDEHVDAMTTKDDNGDDGNDDPMGAVPMTGALLVPLLRG